jgi:hypothetical protein
MTFDKHAVQAPTPVPCTWLPITHWAMHINKKECKKRSAIAAGNKLMLVQWRLSQNRPSHEIATSSAIAGEARD